MGTLIELHRNFSGGYPALTEQRNSS